MRDEKNIEIWWGWVQGWCFFIWWFGFRKSCSEFSGGLTQQKNRINGNVDGDGERMEEGDVQEGEHEEGDERDGDERCGSGRHERAAAGAGAARPVMQDGGSARGLAEDRVAETPLSDRCAWPALMVPVCVSCALRRASRRRMSSGTPRMAAAGHRRWRGSRRPWTPRQRARRRELCARCAIVRP